MAIVSGQRADYQRINNIRIGKSKPKRIASNAELVAINTAIVALNNAKHSTNESEFLVLISEAVKVARDLWRGRNDM